jgi:DNA-directed RNA polymerase II subunit RPB1
MKAVWELAKSKMVCEGGDNDEDGLEDDLDEKRKNKHGGCGNKQPLIRKDGLKLYAHFRSTASDVSKSE